MRQVLHHSPLSERKRFNRFLVLDYVLDSSEKHYYLCPARKDDGPRRIVAKEWTFLPSPCIFLNNRRCEIEEVKPRGGREFFCQLMSTSKYDLIRYSKKRAARDWSMSPVLDQLLLAAIQNESATEAEDRM
jgi:Fe-S-cluster containining protein